MRIGRRNWLDADIDGLRKTIERLGKPKVLCELIQNAWDQNITYADIRLARVPHTRDVLVTVEDDDPNGFAKLSDVYTVYAESTKKSDPTRRGRFGFGEKAVLAICDQATVLSTKGGVRFDADGRHSLRSKRERGTIIEARLKMTNGEMAEFETLVHRLLPPQTVVTRFNGEIVVSRKPVAVLSATLPTDIADDEGVLVRRQRKAELWVFKVRKGEVGTLYELGIPVVETGDAYHIDVQQKVPLNADRDNVPPAYLRDVRTLVVNAMHQQLTVTTVNTPWVRDALADPTISVEAVQSIIHHRFGKKAVIHDPSDREANNTARAKGYHVIYGSQMSADEWTNVRRAGYLPAGQVAPTPKPFDPDGNPLKIWRREDWSFEMIALETKIQRIAMVCLGFEVQLTISIDTGWNNKFNGAYGGRALTLSRRVLGHDLQMTESVIDLLLHEFGHEYCDDHTVPKYYHALTKLGARLALAAARDPTLLV